MVWVVLFLDWDVIVRFCYFLLWIVLDQVWFCIGFRMFLFGFGSWFYLDFVFRFAFACLVLGCFVWVVPFCSARNDLFLTTIIKLIEIKLNLLI